MQATSRERAESGRTEQAASLAGKDEEVAMAVAAAGAAAGVMTVVGPKG